jgi:hypothetical protein
MTPQKTFGVKLRVKFIKMSTYVKDGSMLVLRTALDRDHPEYPYNWIMRTFGGAVRPEEFGFFKPRRRASEDFWDYQPWPTDRWS